VRRLYAAKWVAAHALSDPRALPALLDRLEHDPAPVIRKVVASRMLTRLADQPQVRAALQAAAASDHDPLVRWAARYALHVDTPGR
jgi:HEAT repeat protein